MSEPRDLTGIKLGNYRLERQLGRGQMGVVYLAQDEALLRPTAVKVLSWSIHAPAGQDPELWFLAEARSVARVNHPAVVQIYSVARHGPYCYIAMEYVEGVSADVLVAERGPFPADRATEVIAQIAGALYLAHSGDIVHRDVKPANVLIRADGTAKLGDFGMALQLDAEQPAASRRAGTPHYLAPEVWRGEPASPATDIYALGGTYFFLLTGRPPFDARDVAEVAASHLGEEVRSPHEVRPEVPAQCSAIVRRCMAKARKERYRSAQELQWDLRGLLRELELPAPPVAPSTSAAAEIGAASPAPGGADWTSLRFLSRPFGDVDPLRPPYTGEPFASALQQLRERLAAPGQPVLLTGPGASGRTVVARRLQAECTGSAASAYLDVAPSISSARTLVPRVARAFGALPGAVAGANSDIDGLLDHLRVALTSGEPPALLVVDGLVPEAPLVDELMLLARAASSTRYFRLLMVGSAAMADALAESALLGPPVRLQALDHGQMREYLASWVRACLAPDAPPIVITPDAALLVSRRGGGNLRRANAIAANMIRLAARSDSRLVTTWEAWIAPDEESAPMPDLSRPASWPSPEVLALVNECRAEIGAPPRP